MLRLPQFEVFAPETVSEAIDALKEPGARIVAGGTDILPNLKHRLDQPPRLVSLKRIRPLREVQVERDCIRIGSGVTLSVLSQHENVKELFPSLANAASLVASPLIRNMGTIGGNVNLDTRCRYVNQSDFWRDAIGGGCLKSEGDVCHVVPGGKNCVAAMSSDCVPVLMSLQASAVLEGPGGQREILLKDYFTANGIAHTKREEGEIMTSIVVPRVHDLRQVSAYQKWSMRKSIDFPLISVALCFELDRNNNTIENARIVVGVLGSRPRVVTGLEALRGKQLDDANVEELCTTAVFKQCKPLPNVPYEADYRRKMLPVYTRRALRSLISA